mgnify:CR=1 FL=1
MVARGPENTAILGLTTSEPVSAGNGLDNKISKLAKIKSDFIMLAREAPLPGSGIPVFCKPAQIGYGKLRCIDHDSLN